MRFPASVAFLLCCFAAVRALRCWTCENANSPENCLKTGYSRQCTFVEKVCQTETRYSVGWRETPIIRTGCKEPLACGNNDVQNPRRDSHRSQCNENRFNSVCRCCCAGNHCNTRNLLCTKNSKPEETNVQLTFQTEAPEIHDAETSLTPPKEPSCGTLPRPPTHGGIQCDGIGESGTVCTFSCDDGFVLIGPTSTTCEKEGSSLKWSNTSPQCVVPQRQCLQLGYLPHGRVSCSRGDGTVGTVCNFECTDDGYSLLGRNETECQQVGREALWSNRKPCCSALCPPIARKDIVIVMDSSKSIRPSEWTVMKNFVINVIRRFEVERHSAQFAVFRFAGKADAESQVLLGDYENVDELTLAVQNMPKKRGGTRLGEALRHARDNVLTHKNRPEVGDMIWVLTDGKSKDDFLSVAAELRRNGVEIVALWVARKGEEEYKKQLAEMTGNKDFILTVDDIIKSFSSDLSERVTGKICEISCE